MQRNVFTDGSSRYTRISKLQARKLFNAGQSFYIIAHKMRPGFSFNMGMTIDGARYAAENAECAKYELSQVGFDSIVANFCYYNANCHETGTYPAFYLVSERNTGVKHLPNISSMLICRSLVMGALQMKHFGATDTDESTEGATL